MINVLYTLLGGALVVIGVLVAAVADRVRGLRLLRAAERPTERQVTRSDRDPRDNEPIKSLRPEPRSETRMRTMADEVVAALVASGYKKAVAAEAAWGCGAADRSTIEGWTAAALRRAGKGAPS